MRFAGFDPPYIGQAKKHYSHDERCAEVNHTVLIGYGIENYDGFFLNTHVPGLRPILDICESYGIINDVRVGAWVKPFASFKPGVNPGYCWEPIVFYGCKRKRSRTEKTIKDFVSCNIELKKGLAGAKPEKVCRWMFDMLGLDENDTLEDIFPGTGAIGNAWDKYKKEKLTATQSKNITQGTLY